MRVERSESLDATEASATINGVMAGHRCDDFTTAVLCVQKETCAEDRRSTRGISGSAERGDVCLPRIARRPALHVDGGYSLQRAR